MYKNIDILIEYYSIIYSLQYSDIDITSVPVTDSGCCQIHPHGGGGAGGWRGEAAGVGAGGGVARPVAEAGTRARAGQRPPLSDHHERVILGHSARLNYLWM